MQPAGPAPEASGQALRLATAAPLRILLAGVHSPLQEPVVPDNSYSPFWLIFSTICIKLPASDTRFAQSRGSYIMMPILRALLAFAVSLVRSRVSLQLEILALQHQLAVYRRSIRRPHVRPSDRIFWSWLSRGWARWRGSWSSCNRRPHSPGSANAFATTGLASAGGNRAGRRSARKSGS